MKFTVDGYGTYEMVQKIAAHYKIDEEQTIIKFLNFSLCSIEKYSWKPIPAIFYGDTKDVE